MKDQQLRLLAFLKSDNIEEAKRAYDFIKGEAETDKNAITKCNVGDDNTRLKDGIYLEYEDGHVELFTGENDNPRQVEYIGIIDGEQRLAVALNDLGNHRLPYKEGYEDKNYSNYKKGDIPAVFDFKGRENTKHLLEQGDFEFELQDCEWIPSIGELALIYRHKGEINDALEYVDGDLLGDKWYWSSTEVSATIAWRIYFSNGNLLNNNKQNYISVRAVAAF